MRTPDLRITRPTPIRTGRIGVGLLLGMTLVLLLGGTATAGETNTFGTTPHPVKVDGEPRGSFSVPENLTDPAQDTLRVYNRTDQPLSLRVYAAPAELGDDGVYAVGFSHQSGGLAERIQPETESVDLAPKGDALVRFTVSPGDAPDGLAALVVEPADPRTAGTVDLVERVAILVKTTSTGAGNLVGPPPADDATPVLPIAIAIAVAAAVLAALLVWRRARRSSTGSDEPADEVPHEDGARDVHERVHAAPPTS